MPYMLQRMIVQLRKRRNRWLDVTAVDTGKSAAKSKVCLLNLLHMGKTNKSNSQACSQGGFKGFDCMNSPCNMKLEGTSAILCIL